MFSIQRYHSASIDLGEMVISPARVRFGELIEKKFVSDSGQAVPRKDRATHPDRLLSHRLAIDPPLGFHDGLNDVPGLAADRDLHRVVLGFNVETGLLESGDDGNPGVETLHALEKRTKMTRN
jgi:hypothetical protein